MLVKKQEMTWIKDTSPLMKESFRLKMKFQKQILKLLYLPREAEQAGNVKTALENLQQARASVDERIKSLELEIGEASRKITSLSETNSVFGPESSDELEAKKVNILVRKRKLRKRYWNYRAR